MKKTKQMTTTVTTTFSTTTTTLATTKVAKTTTITIFVYDRTFLSVDGEESDSSRVDEVGASPPSHLMPIPVPGMVCMLCMSLTSFIDN